jgi:T-complex protein 1 subunit theta
MLPPNFFNTVLRASTNNVLSDLERAIDDGVHAAKRVCKNGMLVYGAGATEMELSIQIQKYADSRPGLDQYAIRAFGNALQFVPRILAENSGLDAGVLIASLGALHAEGIKSAGVNVNSLLKQEHLKDLDDKFGINVETDIFDIMTTKLNAFRLAIDAALTVLKVDQVIMSKPSGGPKMKK